MTFNIITSLGRSNPVLPTIIPAVIMLTLFAGILYFSIKKAYKNNPVAGETIDYTITPEQLQMVGETYKAELAWSNIPKVTLTGKWLFIWHNSQLARAIPRRDITETFIAELKSILNKNGVKHNLR